MGVEKKVNFTRIRGEKESHQVCSQFFSADDKLIKLKLLIIDGQSKSAFKVRISPENFDKNEEIVKEAFELSDSHDLEFRFDRENATTMLLYRQDVVFRNVPFSVENFVDARRTMFELAVVDTDAKMEKLDDLKSRQTTLEVKIEDHRKKLKEIVEEKLKIEGMMVGRFLPILKSKDQKISGLVKTCQTLASKFHSVSSSEEESDDPFEDNPLEESVDPSSQNESCDENISMSII
jgi:hypothetical protein